MDERAEILKKKVQLAHPLGYMNFFCPLLVVEMDFPFRCRPKNLLTVVKKLYKNLLPHFYSALGKIKNTAD